MTLCSTISLLRIRTHKKMRNALSLVVGSLLMGMLCLWADGEVPVANPGTSLVTWDAPSDTPLNPTYKVQVREPWGDWHPLPVHNMKVGHQAGDPLRLSANPKSRLDSADASFVLFDFDKTVEIQITYTKGSIHEFKLSPESYGIDAKLSGGDTVVFSIAQRADAPRKMVFRPNGDYESECLHLLTNPVEKDAPNPADANVLVIQPGDGIPRSLPEGKSVYYFAPGVHTLPVGAWVEIDLGEKKTLAGFDLETVGKQLFRMPGGLRFRIEARVAANENWRTVYESLDRADNFHLSGVSLEDIEARYVRIVLLGNHLDELSQRKPTGANYPHSCFIKQFTLYDSLGRNVSAGKAVAGSGGDFRKITDGKGESSFGGLYVAETFFIPSPNTRIYLAPGSVLRGAIGGKGLSKIRIGGRGILDGSVLSHDLIFREGRSSSIQIVESSEIEVEGITILDGAMWSVVLNQNRQVAVRNINILNRIVNADGIHFSATRQASATGCFIRACDDLLVIYHYGETRDIRFQNCVLWSDGGRAALFGMGNQGDIRNVRLEDCDVLACQGVWDMKTHGGVFMVWPSGARLIEDVTFKEIRIEAPRYPSLAALFQLKTVAWENLAPGRLNHVRFENIHYPSPGSFLSRIMGADMGHPVEDVRLHRLHWGGDTLNANWAGQKIETNEFVKGLVID